MTRLIRKVLEYGKKKDGKHFRNMKKLIEHGLSKSFLKQHQTHVSTCKKAISEENASTNHKEEFYLKQI